MWMCIIISLSMEAIAAIRKPHECQNSSFTIIRFKSWWIVGPSTVTNLVIAKPYVLIDDGEDKYMIMKRLSFSVILWSSKYLKLYQKEKEKKGKKVKRKKKGKKHKHFRQNKYIKQPLSSHCQTNKYIITTPKKKKNRKKRSDKQVNKTTTSFT